MDNDQEDPDFIEFEFNDADIAVAAEKAFPLNVVNLGTSLALRSGVVDAIGEEIRDKLREHGLEWTEAPSGLTEEDMWPVYPEDGDTSPSM